MGRPQNPTAAEYNQIKAAGRLAQIEYVANVTVEDGKIVLRTSLPRQGVSLLRLEA